MSPKTDAVLIRLTPEDKARLQRVAEAAYLEPSTWARQALLRAVAQAEEPEAKHPAPAKRRRSGK